MVSVHLSMFSLVTFAAVLKKQPCQNKVKREGCVVPPGLGVQSIMAGKEWQQKCEATIHIASTVVKQRQQSVFSSLSLFYLV